MPVQESSPTAHRPAGDDAPDVASAEADPGPAPAIADPHPHPHPQSRSRSWRLVAALDRLGFWPAVWGAVAVGFALRLAAGLTDDAPASDETAYLRSGINLLDGLGFTRGGHPELHFPPFVPFVLGLTHKLVGDAHAASVVVTLVAGTAVIVPLALVARRVAGPRLGVRAGIAAAWVAAVLPGLATMPATRGTGSEAVYTLTVVAATWLALAAAAREGRTRLALAAAAGTLVGFAYLTRPEGLFIAGPLAVALAWPALRLLPRPRRLRRRPGPPGATGASAGAGRGPGRRAAVRSTLASVLVFGLPIVVCVAPYVAFLHDNTGQWGLTAKTQDESIEAWHAVARGDRLTRDSILYRLDETGLQFVNERRSLTTLAREDPSGYAAILRTNLGELGSTAIGWTLVPIPVTALAVWAVWLRRRSGAALVVAAVSVLPIATALAFFVQPRYLVLTVAMLTALSGVGLAALGRRWRPWAAAGMLGLCLVASIQQFDGGSAGWGRPADFADQRLAGEWIADHAEPGERVVTRSMVIDFYAERPTVALPYAPLDDVLRFARHYGARYLVADSAHIGRFRPQLTALLTDDDIDGLRLVHEVSAEGRTTRVFELDPVPPPSDDRGPALGFMGDG
jgi:hypothetical protein